MTLQDGRKLFHEGVVAQFQAADLVGIKTLDFDFVIEIVMAWVQAMGGVDNPLKSGSSNGATSLESSMPMSPPS